MNMLSLSSVLFQPRVGYVKPWSGELIILAPGKIPTVDFYITSRLPQASVKQVITYDSVEPVTQVAPVEGAFVVIVRHSSLAWLDYLKRHASMWSGVAYLMDDDIPGAVWCRDIPFAYARRTTQRYLSINRGLAKVCDQIWLSTQALKNRYKKISTKLVSPQSFGVVRQASPLGVKRWGYHGTYVHKQEIDWLVSLVKQVHQAEPEAEFEIFGDDRTAYKFRAIPRVTVLPPMSWIDYVAHCYASNLAVGLAPMLPGRFNQVRSYAKAFDIARSGAVGIFSICESYAPLQECAGAILLENDQNIWVNEVLSLLQDDALRLNRYEQFLSWVEKSSHDVSFESLVSR